MISLTKTPLLQGIGERERILFLVYIYIPKRPKNKK